jgi:VWFA-related protein
MKSPPRATTLASALVISVATAAQEPREEGHRHGIFLDRIDVNLVNIEVVAVDSSGQPVLGLTRDDFELFEDGEAVSITHFFTVEEAMRVDPGDAAEWSPEEGSALSREEPRYVVVFVDHSNISPQNRRRVLAGLQQELDRLLNAAARVLVVSQENTLTIEQPFTRDRSLVTAALERLGQVATVAGVRLAEARNLQTQIERGQAPGGGSGAALGAAALVAPGPTPEDEARQSLAGIQALAQAVGRDVQQTLRELERFVGSLAGLPGRKAVLFVSDGLEVKPAERLFRIWEDKYRAIAPAVGVGSIDFEIERYSLATRLRSLIDAANASRVTFYTLEGGNERGSGTLSAEVGALAPSSFAGAADGDRQLSLRSLAQETGGSALLDGAPVTAALARLERDFRNYYSLGYIPPNPGADRSHRVEVKVHRPGVRLSYLGGYRDKTRDERMVDETLASLFFDAGDNPLGIQVELGSVKVESKDQYLVPVMVRIPMDRLVFVPQAQVHQGRLSIFVTVQDRQGRLSDPHKIDVPIEIPNGELLQAMSRTAGYLAQVRTRGGEQKLAIGVRDEVAAVASTVNLSVSVGGR